MTILAIDTSTQWCSVALVDPKGDSGNPQSPLSLVRHENLGAEASQYALDWVEQLLTEAHINFRDLEAVAVGIGPGAFTGIRIGVGIAQGMAFAADLPCLPIVCLDAVALEGIQSLKLVAGETILVAVDARMNEVYWATYIVQNNGLPGRVGDLYLSFPSHDIDGTEYSGTGTIPCGAVSASANSNLVQIGKAYTAKFFDGDIGEIVAFNGSTFPTAGITQMTSKFT